MQKRPNAPLDPRCSAKNGCLILYFLWTRVCHSTNGCGSAWKRKWIWVSFSMRPVTSNKTDFFFFNRNKFRWCITIRNIFVLAYFNGARAYERMSCVGASFSRGRSWIAFVLPSEELQRRSQQQATQESGRIHGYSRCVGGDNDGAV